MGKVEPRFSARAPGEPLNSPSPTFRPAAVTKPSDSFAWTSLTKHTQLNTTPERFPKLGHLHDPLELATAQLAARDHYEAIIKEAEGSVDFKSFSRDVANRDRLTSITAHVLSLVRHHDKPLEHMVRLLRSRTPGRAQPNVNPSRIAVAAQPALEAGLLTNEQVAALTEIARSGVKLSEIRDLTGPALDLAQNNTKDPEDHAILLDFYFEQAFMSRTLIFPPNIEQELLQLGEIIVSASFLVRVPGQEAKVHT